MPSNNEKKGPRPFQPGNRHGRGRPAGSRNRATLLLDQLAAGEGENILKKVLEKAQEGDLKAAELLLARIWPPRRGRPVRLSLPPTDTATGVDAALATVIGAVAAGEVTPEEAGAIAGLLETKRRAIETAAEMADADQRPQVSFQVNFVSPTAAPDDRPQENLLPGENVAVFVPVRSNK
ncbi:MAG: hypothetical protein JNM48_16190 [Rhodospirillales bacterium]|nr:hypothetical protein [Rhodospirillales bacterium]